MRVYQGAQSRRGVRRRTNLVRDRHLDGETHKATIRGRRHVLESSAAWQLYWNHGRNGGLGDWGRVEDRGVIRFSTVGKIGGRSSRCGREMKVSAAENDLFFRLVDSVLGCDQGCPGKIKGEAV